MIIHINSRSDEWLTLITIQRSLASEPPYGGCLTSHNAQDPDLFKLSRNYCQCNTIVLIGSIRLSLTINLLAISAVYRYGCRYLKIQFQKHYRSLKITLHGDLSLSSIQKWTDAFISFRFVLIWLLHNKNYGRMRFCFHAIRIILFFFKQYRIHN